MQKPHICQSYMNHDMMFICCLHVGSVYNFKSIFLMLLYLFLER